MPNGLSYTNITHELRTPLTLIIGPLEDLINDMKMQETYGEKLALSIKRRSPCSN